jgi:polyisoprenoid-binding protein YceI
MRKVVIALGLAVGFALLGYGSLPQTQADSPKGGAGSITPENSKIDFVGTKKDGKHDGGFKKFSGSLKPVDGDITKATLTVEIDTTSLFADDPKLTQHLKSPDFFDVKKYPDAKFVSKEIKADTITGDLTLHGVTKSMTFPAKVTTTDDTVTVESTFKFDRTDFGISYKPDMVDKEVTVKVTAKVGRK